MTTQDKNKVIAEWIEKYTKPELEGNYHTSWDWLIPVVDRIEATKKYIVAIVGNNCFIQDIESYKKMAHPTLFINEYGETKILAVHEAVYQFIIMKHTQAG